MPGAYLAKRQSWTGAFSKGGHINLDLGARDLVPGIKSVYVHLNNAPYIILTGPLMMESSLHRLHPKHSIVHNCSLRTTTHVDIPSPP